MVKQFFTKLQPITLKQKAFTAIIFVVLLLSTPVVLLSITHKQNTAPKKLVAAAHREVSLTPQPTETTPTPSITPFARIITVTPKPTLKPNSINSTGATNTPSSNNTSANNQPTSQTNNNAVVIAAAIQVSPISTSQQITTPTTQPTKATETVNVQITEPDGTSNFQVDVHDGNSVCDVLQTAKAEGKIKSLTLDNSYMDSLHSAYIKELNGFSSNWTFTVNGNSPQGCSLYNPKPNDSIVWKFG